MKYWKLYMSVASQTNASMSLPSFRAPIYVFKRLRKNRQNINTEKSTNIYLYLKCCLKPRSQLLPMVLVSRSEEWYSRRVYLHLHELLISLLELGTKGMLLCINYIGAMNQGLVPTLEVTDLTFVDTSPVKAMFYFYKRICRGEGFGLPLGKGEWPCSHFDLLQTKTNSKIFSHSFKSRTRQFNGRARRVALKLVQSGFM